MCIAVARGFWAWACSGVAKLHRQRQNASTWRDCSPCPRAIAWIQAMGTCLIIHDAACGLKLARISGNHEPPALVVAVVHESVPLPYASWLSSLLLYILHVAGSGLAASSTPQRKAERVFRHTLFTFNFTHNSPLVRHHASWLGTTTSPACTYTTCTHDGTRHCLPCRAVPMRVLCQ
jgi:hypothetical protein